MPKSMADMLASGSPALPPPIPGQEEVTTVDDLTRILALPTRQPLNCAKDPRTKEYEPATEALIQVVTEKYARKKRLSCGCRERKITMLIDGRISIQRVLPEGYTPEPPQITTVAEFVADNQSNADEALNAKLVSNLKPGGEVTLPAVDRGTGHPCIVSLNAVQAWSLWEAKKAGGLLGFKGVGSGKTVSGVLAPLVFSDAKLAVLLIEPSQRTHYLSHYLRLREHFRVPSIVFDDDTGYTVPGTPPLHVVPYSRLSRPNATEMMERLSPDVIIADEAHRLTGDSVTAGRVWRYLKKRLLQREEALAAGLPVKRRAIYFLAWSGTLEAKSVKDTQAVSVYALGTGSPLPLDPSEADRWSAVFDPSKQPDRNSSTARSLQVAFGKGAYNQNQSSSILTLFDAPEEEIRKGFQKRRSQTLGVVSSSVSTVNAALYIKERKTPPIPVAVQKALMGVRDDMLRPDGDEIVEKVKQIEIAREVALGFFYRWVFTKNKCTCEVQGQEPACPGCTLIKDWFAKRKAYGRELRVRLESRVEHLDSPKLCKNAAERAKELGEMRTGNAFCATCRNPWPCNVKSHLPAWAAPTWPAWESICDKVPHEQRTTWIDEYMARDAAEWALSNKGIVWFQSDAFGRKVAEISGLNFHGGGPDAEAKIKAENGKKSIIVSIQAHGVGRDGLQEKFSKQLITQFPSSNKRAEQLLGRLHRQGTRADVIETEVYLPTQEYRDAFRKAVAEAEFNKEMSGNDQKLLYADIDIDL
jgi:hypothetical protein